MTILIICTQSVRVVQGSDYRSHLLFLDLYIYIYNIVVID